MGTKYPRDCKPGVRGLAEDMIRDRGCTLQRPGYPRVSGANQKNENIRKFKLLKVKHGNTAMFLHGSIRWKVRPTTTKITNARLLNESLPPSKQSNEIRD